MIKLYTKYSFFFFFVFSCATLPDTVFICWHRSTRKTGKLIIFNFVLGGQKKVDLHSESKVSREYPDTLSRESKLITNCGQLITHLTVLARFYFLLEINKALARKYCVHRLRHYPKTDLSSLYRVLLFLEAKISETKALPTLRVALPRRMFILRLHLVTWKNASPIFCFGKFFFN